MRGVLVRLGSARVGLARATEVGDMLATIGAKMPVWCYADDYSNGTLALAARGCKRVWVAPGSSVDAIGLAAQTIYFHKLLVDEIGLDVDFLQVGKFKGAEEPFTRDGPSPEARQSLESTMAELRSAWLEGIDAGPPARRYGPRPRTGRTAPEGARDRGLVDDVGYLDQARAALETATGAVRSEVRLGPGSQGSADGLTDLLRIGRRRHARRGARWCSSRRPEPSRWKAATGSSARAAASSSGASSVRSLASSTTTT